MITGTMMKTVTIFVTRVGSEKFIRRGSGKNGKAILQNTTLFTKSAGCSIRVRTPFRRWLRESVFVISAGQ